MFFTWLILPHRVGPPHTDQHAKDAQTVDLDPHRAIPAGSCSTARHRGGGWRDVALASSGRETRVAPAETRQRQISAPARRPRDNAEISPRDITTSAANNTTTATRAMACPMRPLQVAAGREKSFLDAVGFFFFFLRLRLESLMPSFLPCLSPPSAFGSSSSPPLASSSSLGRKPSTPAVD
ncbi:hypothetical protein VTN02DRAFT_3028 [Thermoascus thermophilus]